MVPSKVGAVQDFFVRVGHSNQCTEVRFASFFSGGFITAIVVNPLERRLTKRTSVQSTAGNYYPKSYVGGFFASIESLEQSY